MSVCRHELTGVSRLPVAYYQAATSLPLLVLN